MGNRGEKVCLHRDEFPFLGNGLEDEKGTEDDGQQGKGDKARKLEHLVPCFAVKFLGGALVQGERPAKAFA